MENFPIESYPRISFDFSHERRKHGSLNQQHVEEAVDSFKQAINRLDDSKNIMDIQPSLFSNHEQVADMTLSRGRPTPSHTMPPRAFRSNDTKEFKENVRQGLMKAAEEKNFTSSNPFFCDGEGRFHVDSPDKLNSVPSSAIRQNKAPTLNEIAERGNELARALNGSSDILFASPRELHLIGNLLVRFLQLYPDFFNDNRELGSAVQPIFMPTFDIPESAFNYNTEGNKQIVKIYKEKLASALHILRENFSENFLLIENNENVTFIDKDFDFTSIINNNSVAVNPHIARKALTQSGVVLHLPEVYRGIPTVDADRHARYTLPQNTCRRVDLLTGIYSLIQNPHNLINRYNLFANYYTAVTKEGHFSRDNNLLPYSSINPYDGGIQLRFQSPDLFSISHENRDYGRSTMGIIVVPEEEQTI